MLSTTEHNPMAAVTFTPIPSPLLSIIGSSCIIYRILAHPNHIRKIHKRIVFCMSAMDVIQSLALGFSTFPAPRDSHTIYAYGNVVTCDIQGFIHHMGQSVMCYNSVLTLTFLLRIRFNMSEKKIRTRIEPFLHLISFVWPLATAVVALKMDLYNFGSNRCWIHPYPFDCTKDENIPCTRGQNAFLWRWVLFAGLSGIWMIWLPLSNIWIYCTVRRLEVRIGKRLITSSSGTQSSSSRKIQVTTSEKTKTLGIQCILYSIIIYMTVLWPFIARIVEQKTGLEPFWLVITNQVFYPLQGFFNWIIFMRPQMMKLRRESPEKGWLWVVHQAIYTRKK